MRVLLKLVLRCDADAAWRGVTSPAGLQQVSAPLMHFDSLEPAGFPETWGAGEHPVKVSALGGVVPLGEQVIAIGFPPARAGARLVRDTGYGVSGIFPLVRRWRHTMAVAPASASTTLYRDELSFDAGRLTLAMWPVYWTFWQWRGARLRQAARSW